MENAQKSVESRNFRSRKNVLEYDNVMNTQREVIYAQRQKVLDGEDLQESITNMREQVISSTVADALADFGGQVTQESLQAVASRLQGVYYPIGTVLQSKTQNELTEEILSAATALYEAKEARYSPNMMRELERVFMLRAVDEYWMDHIDAMDDLKQGIGLRAYGQHDPVIAYKEEGYEMFQAMITAIREETVRRLMTVELRPSQEVKRQRVAVEFSTSGDQTVKKQPVRSTGKVGPNDPCPCGSGKKYKKCCMHKDQ